jgi:hypothetical protein
MPQVYGAMPVLARVCQPLCLESEPNIRRIVLLAAGTSSLPQLLSSLTGRFPTKSHRWADDDDNPTTYLDVVRRPAKPVHASPPRTQTRPFI